MTNLNDTFVLGPDGVGASALEASAWEASASEASASEDRCFDGVTSRAGAGGLPSDGDDLVQQHLKTLSAIIELISQINSAVDLEEAGTVAAHAIRHWAAASAVELFWQRKSKRACQMIGRSGAECSDVQDQVALRLAAAEEALTRYSVTDSGAVGKRHQVALLAVRRYAKATGTRRLLGVSLRPESGECSDGFALKDQFGDDCCGVILLHFERFVSENEASRLRSSLDAAQGPLFHALTKVAMTEPNGLTKWFRTGSGNSTSKKLKLALFGVALLIGVLLIPMSYHAPIRSELQPVGRRYVAAPVAGTLEKVFVHPGDDIRSGTLLARFDARELKMELAGKRSELVRLQQEQKGQLAQHQFAESKLASLRAEKLHSEIELLELRRQRLEVKSPIDGVIVTGDWKRSEGTLLELGETLFEIAPPGEFNVEVSVAESDVLLVRHGMSLRFRLDSMPNRLFEAHVERIHPRSELRDNENVFLAEATLIDADGVLRPGMRGRGSIETDPHPIGWNLFHKAYHRLLVLIGV